MAKGLAVCTYDYNPGAILFTFVSYKINMIKNIKNAVVEKFSGGMHFIGISTSIADAFLKAGHKRLIVTIASQSFHAALLSRKDTGYYVQFGATVMKQLALKKGKAIALQLEADQTKYQFAIPEEFLAVLEQDAEAAAKFNSLTAGNKRSLLYLVSQPKSIEKRIERALNIAGKIKQGITSARVILQ